MQYVAMQQRSCGSRPERTWNWLWGQNLPAKTVAVGLRSACHCISCGARICMPSCA